MTMMFSLVGATPSSMKLLFVRIHSAKVLIDHLVQSKFWLKQASCRIINYFGLGKLYRAGHAKMCHMPYANNKGADQPARPSSPIAPLLFAA